MYTLIDNMTLIITAFVEFNTNFLWECRHWDTMERPCGYLSSDIVHVLSIPVCMCYLEFAVNSTCCIEKKKLSHLPKWNYVRKWTLVHLKLVRWLWCTSLLIEANFQWVSDQLWGAFHTQVVILLLASG